LIVDRIALNGHYSYSGLTYGQSYEEKKTQINKSGLEIIGLLTVRIKRVLL